MKTNRIVKIAIGMFLGGSIVASGAYLAGASTSVSFKDGGIELQRDGKIHYLKGIKWEKAEKKVIEDSLDGINKINFNIESMDVSILSGEKYKIEATYSEKEKFEYEVKDGTLFINEKVVENSISGSDIDYNVKVYIPKEKLIEDVQINVGAGNVTLEEIYTKALKVSIGAGDINIRGKLLGENEVYSQAGNITIKMQEADRLEYNYDVETAMGEIYVGEKTIENEYAFGGHIVEDNKAHNNLKAKTEVGNLKIDFK